MFLCRREAPSPLFSAAVAFLIVLTASPAFAGYWQLTETTSIGPIDNTPCEAGLEASPQGRQLKLFAAGPTSIELGTYASWEASPYWTRHRVLLPALPARLDEGQKIQWPIGIDVLSGNRFVDASGWIERKSGIGGGDDEIAGLTAGTESVTATSGLHTVPNGPAAQGQYLTYWTGGGWTGGFTCNFIYRYAWIDEPNPETAVEPGPAESSPVVRLTTEMETDRIGSDYKRLIAVATAEQCRDLCQVEPMCRAYTWVRKGVQGPDPVCYLKNRVPPATPSNCCTSGRK